MSKQHMQLSNENDEYREIINKLEFVFLYLRQYDSCEISCISLDEFKEYVDNLNILLQVDRNDIIDFVKENFIYYHYDNYPSISYLTLENLVIIYKYLLDVYDNTKCIHYVGSYTNAIFGDYFLNEGIQGDSSYTNAKNISDKKRLYLTNSIDKQRLIDFFDTIIDNMSITSMFFSYSIEGFYSVVDINNLILTMFKLNHDKEWVCKTINKVFSRLVEFSKEDKTKYYRKELDEFNNKTKYYNNDYSYEKKSYNKSVDDLYDTCRKEKCNNYIYHKYDSDKLYQIISQVYDATSQPDVNYLSLNKCY